MKNLLLTIVFVSMFAGQTWAACTGSSPTWTSTPDQTSVASCISQASAGDTINVSAGSATWTCTSSGVSIGKPLTILGAGAANTTITTTGACTDGLFYFNNIPTTSTNIRVSGFNFNLTNWNSMTAIMIDTVHDDNIRIDNNIFYFGRKPIRFYHWNGVIDSNTFYNPDIGIEYSAEEDDTNSWSSLSGGSDACFVEGNTFIDDSNFPSTSADEKIGTFDGGKLVARYNTFTFTSTLQGSGNTDGTIQTHGNAAGGFASK